MLPSLHSLTLRTSRESAPRVDPVGHNGDSGNDGEDSGNDADEESTLPKGLHRATGNIEEEWSKLADRVAANNGCLPLCSLWTCVRSQPLGSTQVVDPDGPRNVPYFALSAGCHLRYLWLESWGWDWAWDWAWRPAPPVRLCGCVGTLWLPFHSVLLCFTILLVYHYGTFDDFALRLPEDYAGGGAALGLFQLQLAHATAVHLQSNVVSILVAGSVYEMLNGTRYAAQVFWGGGVFGAGVEVLTRSASCRWSLCGASAGAYALLGAYGGHLFINWESLDPCGALTLVVLYAAVALVEITYALDLDDDSVAVVAHLAGALYGLVAGVAFSHNIEWKLFGLCGVRGWLTEFAVRVVVIVVAAGAFVGVLVGVGLRTAEDPHLLANASSPLACGTRL